NHDELLRELFSEKLIMIAPYKYHDDKRIFVWCNHDELLRELFSEKLIMIAPYKYHDELLRE
ncbi:hypothetical protein PS004_23490, partial [Shigella sonnei]|nr:hypothetical protein [Shigella sonnei]